MASLRPSRLAMVLFGSAWMSRSNVARRWFGRCSTRSRPEHRVPRVCLFDQLDELCGGDVLGQESVYVQGEGFGERFLVFEHGEHHHSDRRVEPDHFLRGRRPVENGHVHVQQSHVQFPPGPFGSVHEPPDREADDDRDGGQQDVADHAGKPDTWFRY